MMVMMMMMVPGCKCGRREEHNDSQKQGLFHVQIIPTKVRAVFLRLGDGDLDRQPLDRKGTPSQAAEKLCFASGTASART
jgi:hypothetical protein